jgi:hypothetical protein
MGNEFAWLCNANRGMSFGIKFVVQQELMESLEATKSESKLCHLLKEVFNEFSSCINLRLTAKHPARY